MKVYQEMRLENFDFWGGAIPTAMLLDSNDFEQVELNLQDLYGETWFFDETFINDLFWFEQDFIAECLGFAGIEELIKEKENVI